MIYFDLDGVIRDISVVLFGGDPKEWGSKVKSGENVFDFINNNLNVLVEAPVTDFYRFRDYKIECILSCQPVRWRFYTNQWIDKFCPGVDVVRYVRKPEDKLSILKNGDFLVEDYPFFSDYSKIILVRRPYNMCVVNPFAEVFTWRDLNSLVGNKGKVLSDETKRKMSVSHKLFWKEKKCASSL